MDGALPRSLQTENAPVTLQVPTTSPAPVVTVPKDAVIPISGGHIVFIAAEGVALQRRVKLGNAAGDAFIVLDGLQPGEQVITRGNEGLVDGRKIMILRPSTRPSLPRVITCSPGCNPSSTIKASPAALPSFTRRCSATPSAAIKTI